MEPGTQRPIQSMEEASLAACAMSVVGRSESEFLLISSAWLLGPGRFPQRAQSRSGVKRKCFASISPRKPSQRRLDPVDPGVLPCLVHRRRIDNAGAHDRQRGGGNAYGDLGVTVYGRVQHWGGPVEEIRPGDVVWFAPGEKHWHGASQTTAMTHIAIQEKLEGEAVGWMEHVSDDQYLTDRRAK